jgi:hypothetical protein
MPALCEMLVASDKSLCWGFSVRRRGRVARYQLFLTSDIISQRGVQDICYDSGKDNV